MGIFLAFTLSNEDKRKLEVPLNLIKNNTIGEYEDSTAFHITLRNISEDDTLHKKIIELMDVWNMIFSDGPVKVYADSFNRFENGDRTVDWIGMSQTLRLYQIYHEVKLVAKKLHIKLKDERFEFIPHITVGFNLKHMNEFEKSFNPIELTLEKMVLWAYDYKLGRTHISSTLHEVKL